MIRNMKDLGAALYDLCKQAEEVKEAVERLKLNTPIGATSWDLLYLTSCRISSARNNSAESLGLLLAAKDAAVRDNVQMSLAQHEEQEADHAE